MKIKYAKKTDILYSRLKDLVYNESDDDTKGVILGYSAEGQLISVEVLNTFTSRDQPSKIAYELA